MKLEALATKAPRETAGADTIRAFDFQMHVSMAKILERHQTPGPYLALFDHADDLVLVEGELTNPDVSFYQMKSSEDVAWTTARLAKRATRGDLPRSIIGKAFYNIVQYGPDIVRASIISNQPLHAGLANGEGVKPSDGEFSFSVLAKDEFAKLTTAINLDFPAGIDSSKLPLLTYERVPFDLMSFRDTVVGRVALFIDATSPEMSLIVKPVYDAIYVEITRCSGHKSKAANFVELTKLKAITRADLDELIDRVRRRQTTPVEWWSMVERELADKGLGATRLQRLRNGCLAYWRARGRGMAAASALSEAIRLAIDDGSALDPDNLLTASAYVELKMPAQDVKGQPFDLLSATIVELMEFFA